MCLPVKGFKVEREWTYRGLKCAVILQREQGHRCGYVRVPPGHPFHGKTYDDVEVRVHGGLTFAHEEPCIEEDGKGWWFGFDCHHCYDAGVNPDIPADYVWQDEKAKKRAEIEYEYIIGKVAGRQEHYWTEEEVVRETEKLAGQLAREGKR